MKDMGTETRTDGLRHILAAGGYSLQGLRRLWRETAFRHEAIAGVAAVVAMSCAGVGFSALALGVVLILLVFAAEALNTALEEVVDHVSPDYSLAAKHAKDLGSLAAAFCVVAAFGYCIAVTSLALVG